MISERKKPIRVGVLGAGRVTKRHTDAMTAMEGIELQTISDPVLETAGKLADLYGATAVTDNERVLQDPSIDVIYICTPHHLHYPYAMEALRNGKHVFIEKPMANTLEECQAINREAQQRSLLVSVGHQQRYFPFNRRLKALLQEGVIGELRMITDHLTVNNQWDSRAPWWKSKATAGGGMMMNLGVHQIDRCLWLMDQQPSTIYSRVRCGLPDLDVDTDYSMMLGMPDGTTINIIGTSYPCKAEFKLEAVGTKGRLSLDLITETLHWSNATETRSEHLPSTGEAAVEVTRRFLTGVRQHTVPEVDGLWGERVIHYAHLAYRSSEEGCVLPIDPDVRGRPPLERPPLLSRS